MMESQCHSSDSFPGQAIDIAAIVVGQIDYQNIIRFVAKDSVGQGLLLTL